MFFIDDADVIFKNGENGGFARKLLTKLDGLESNSISNVCIIMTAMDVADMPPAIVRRFDEAKLIAATDGFTPADLRGLVGDARGHIAYDRHKGRRSRSFQDYLLLAADDIRGRKAILAGLSGKAQPKPRAPKVLTPPPCTEGQCG